MSIHPNITRFVNWIDAQKAEGLLDIKGLCTDNEGLITKLVKSDFPARDNLCAEFMRMIEAPALPHFPGQCGEVRIDSPADAYNYFTNRFNQFVS